MALYRSLEALISQCRVTLVAPVSGEKENEDAMELAKVLPGVNYRIVKCFDTMPASPKQSPSISLRRFGGRVLRKLWPAPTTKSAKLEVRPQNGDAPLPYYPFQCLDSRLLAAISDEMTKGYDLVQAEFAEMLSLGPCLPAEVRKVFVHHQPHFIYAQRFLKNLGDAVRSIHRYTLARIKAEERAYLKAFDSIIVFSETDARELGAFLPGAQIHVSPFPCPENPIENVGGDWKVGHFVFVASENHTPNAMGLAWFMENVWPLLKAKIPDAKIEVIGKWSAAAQSSIPNASQIEFSGFVEKLLPSLAGKIMIVPLWVGSGIRTKILAAWAAGCPVVTTSVGVEGLPGESGRDYLLGDDAEMFLEACVKMALEKFEKECIAKNALALVRANFSLEAVGKKRAEIYQDLLQDKLLTQGASRLL